MISFTVYGKPEPGGSKRAFVMPGKGGKPTARLVDANPNVGGWKSLVAEAALDAVGNLELIHGPVRLTIVFYLARPKGHYRTGRFSGLLKPSAPHWHTTKPDATKLVRGTEDALTGLVWHDDSQVAQLHVEKRYDDRPRAEITVQELTNDGEEEVEEAGLLEGQRP